MLAQKDIFVYEDFLYIFISKDIRYFEIYQSELLNFIPDTPGLLTLLENFANVTVYIFDELSEQYFGKETLSLANELIEFWGI